MKEKTAGAMTASVRYPLQPLCKRAAVDRSSGEAVQSIVQCDTRSQVNRPRVALATSS